MTELINKEYDGESCIDMERDIMEALEDQDVPTDEHGFADGTYRLVLTFTPNSESADGTEPEG